jgi:hypothetical protein
MKEVYTFEDFYKHNSADIPKILASKFMNKVDERHSTVEEMSNAFYCHMLANKICEKFDPKYNVKFSTYVYSCLRNFLQSSRSNAMRVNDEAISLDMEHGESGGTLADLLLVDDNQGVDSLRMQQEIREALMKCKQNKLREHFLSVYEGILLGMNDVEIGERLAMSSTYVSINKQKMVKYLKVYFGGGK